MRALISFLFLPLLSFAASPSVPGPDSDPQYQTRHYAFSLAPDAPRFTWFTIDGLGQGKLGPNPVLAETLPAGKYTLERHRTRSLRGRLTGQKDYFAYHAAGTGTDPVWRVECDDNELVLRSDYLEGAPMLPFALVFDQKANHATLLGVMTPGNRDMPLPCVLHLPDLGSVRVTGGERGARLVYDARRWNVPRPFVRVEFPPANSERRLIEYRLEITAIYPDLKEIRGDRRYDGFRRGFLNMFQVNPRVQMLANNAASDPVAFTIYEYSEMARRAPKLAGDLTCLDLVRMTLEQYMAGAKGYGQAGYAVAPVDADLVAWHTPYTTLDSLPSLLLAACDYAEGAEDWAWARKNYSKLLAWAREMIAADKNGNGIMEYPRSGNYGDRPTANMRPANWWDTINFGHEDAYSNALIYQACRRFAALSRRLKCEAEARTFAAAAGKLAVFYQSNFLNPETGILAGWRSADNQLHDYWFLFVNTVAISYGLVDSASGNRIMDRFLAKMREVGYTNFSIGLPGNLAPVRRGDYVHHGQPPHVFGEPTREDGTDGFQFYENGGATGCYAWFTLRALYQLGRVEDARRILYPMLEGYAAGNFQGFCSDSGMSKDWRDWRGGCHGYEGLLVDNYLALLAVFDDVAAGAR